MHLDLQITEYRKCRENKSKCNPGVDEIDKTSDMSNQLHVSTYIKTITEETDQHANEEHTTKTYGTNIALDVKPRHTDFNTYSPNQLEGDKHIYKPIHDSQKQINTNRLININKQL